jgi:hypothetical protein
MDARKRFPPRAPSLILSPSLKPSGCVNGNRETQRECFQALWVHGWQSQALCRPFKNIHGEFPHPHQPCPPTAPFNTANIGLGGLVTYRRQTAKPESPSRFSKEE